MPLQGEVARDQVPHQDRLHDYSSPARDNNKLDLDNINNNKLNKHNINVHTDLHNKIIIKNRRTVLQLAAI